MYLGTISGPISACSTAAERERDTVLAGGSGAGGHRWRHSASTRRPIVNHNTSYWCSVKWMVIAFIACKHRASAVEFVQ